MVYDTYKNVILEKAVSRWFLVPSVWPVEVGSHDVMPSAACLRALHRNFDERVLWKSSILSSHLKWSALYPGSPRGKKNLLLSPDCFIFWRGQCMFRMIKAKVLMNSASKGNLWKTLSDLWLTPNVKLIFRACISWIQELCVYNTSCEEYLLPF